ncbi:hypothetical protein JAO76_06400 [Pontibacter sp. BT310]|uniref:Uncharacterized protein n=1 Tax=Pontibacter populi TaxID=890055 RepID=A0ABS6X9J5_9BACT|nr:MULTISPECIES: hypothetical protein [Pontibacter]MBJ6117812.1 hypothetical protein [Pontibacter sp. BT310]MBR0570238.1 hypothetical protein [Microvirga sp. STS03]MBW3364664.1 hypothetical protein [Pontibacter populi]
MRPYYNNSEGLFCSEQHLVLFTQTSGLFLRYSSGTPGATINYEQQL